MRSLLVQGTLISLTAVIVLLALSSQSDAYNKFRKQFDAKYMQPDTAIYEALDGKSNCNVCHVGKKKKNRNAYGMALDKLLDKNDREDIPKILKALETVEGLPSVGENSASFADLIRSGKLPITVDEP